MYPKSTAPDKVSDRIAYVNGLIRPMNLKVRDNGHFRMQDKQGNLTRSDGFGLEFADPNLGIDRYAFGQVRKAAYYSGTQVDVRLSKEMLAMLELTPCCYKALDLVRAQPGACMCSARKPADITKSAKAANRKRAREEALAEQAQLLTKANINTRAVTTGAGPSGA